MSKFFGAATVAGAIVAVSLAGPAPAAPPAPYGQADSGAPATAGSARLIVRVPEDAAVYLEGQKMQSTGPLRHYVSPPLRPGVQYTYTVRVDAARDGQTASKTVRVPVQAGQQIEVAGSFAEPGELALNVRPGAQQAPGYRSFSFEPEPPAGQPAAPQYQPYRPAAPYYGTAPSRGGGTRTPGFYRADHKFRGF